MKNIELLAPAGNHDVAIAAINAGANAVYLGGELFGARANADNLTTEEIIDVIDYAHLNKRKVYLTVNTLLKDKEIEQNLYDYLLPLYVAGLDAVIVQDMGVLMFVRKHFKDIHIHASTQMTIFGKRMAEELKNLGVTRVVVPRELSLEEINEIKSVGLEVEAFVHGALCYCYSGQCYLSSFIGARSGNRGRCAQPCRLPYDVIYNNQVINLGDSKYVLSPKDICGINILPEIVKSGVDSLKIEGRMKKKEYVTGVVSIYRKYVDMLEKTDYSVKQTDYNLLLDLFNRNGFSESYYKQHNNSDMISLKKPSFRLENRQFVDSLNKKYSDKILKTNIDIQVKLKENEPFTIKYGDLVEYRGKTPDIAQNKPVDKAFLDKQLRKTNNTDFIIEKIEYDIDDNLFMTIKDVNEARRSFIELMKEYILKDYRRSMPEREDVFDGTDGSVNNKMLNINVQVSSYNQLRTVVNTNDSNNSLINIVYIDLDNYKYDDLEDSIYYCKEEGLKVYLALPRVARLKDINIISKDYLHLLNICDGCLIRSLEQYLFLKDKLETDYVFDSNINVMNRYALDYYRQFGKVTAGVELNSYELSNLDFNEMIVYGRLPVMTSANCCLNTMHSCTKRNEAYCLSDRMNNKFLVKCNCRHCFNVMYNCNPLSLFKYSKDILNQGFDSVRLCFVDESTKEVETMINKARDCFVDDKNVSDMESTTRGHYKRGVI